MMVVPGVAIRHRRSHSGTPVDPRRRAARDTAQYAKPLLSTCSGRGAGKRAGEWDQEAVL